MSKSAIDPDRVRYPHCIVWTPIPLLTWFFPFIGHMGIARTDGVVRDFAGPYYVSVSGTERVDVTFKAMLRVGR